MQIKMSLGSNTAFSLARPFLSLIIGPMKAEKSTRAAQIACKFAHFCNVLLVNSAIDTRHKDNYIIMHSGRQASCIKVVELKELETRDDFKAAQIVVIDEAQFFSDLKEHVVNHCNSKSYVVASLDSDAKQQKFGQVWDLIPFADQVEKLTALCEVCRDGSPAQCSIRVGGSSALQISIDDGQGQKYMSVCRGHVSLGQ